MVGRAATTWAEWLLPPLIALAVLVVFGPALRFGFVGWDDDKVFETNEAIRGFDPRRWHWMWTTFFMGHWHPLTWISIALDYRLWGLDARGYHLTNVVVHVVNALLVYLLARRLIVLGFDERRPGPTALALGAGAAALLFAVHPLRVESVVWATERRDVLSGALLMAAVLAYLRAVQPRQAALRSPVWYLAAVGLLAASLLAKAWGMTLPVVLLILDIYPLRRLGGRSIEWFRGGRARVLIEKTPFVLLAVAAALIAWRAQSETPFGTMPLQRHGLTARTAQAFYGVAFYPLRTLVPKDLSPLYEIPRDLNPFAREYVLAAMVAAGLTAAAVGLRRRLPAFSATWATYLVIVAPVLGVAQSGPQFVADRYSYLSCLSFAVVAGGGLCALLDRPSSGRRAPRTLAGAGVYSVLLVFAVLAHRQTYFWQDSPTLWARVLSLSPESVMANSNLGTHYIERQDWRRAEPYLRRATELDPTWGAAWHNLGYSLYRQKRYEEALAAYRAGQSVSPIPGDTLMAIGNCLYELGRLEEALPVFREAAAFPELTVKAHCNIGLCLRGLGRFEEALDAYDAALRHAPEYSAALAGRALAQQRR